MVIDEETKKFYGIGSKGKSLLYLVILLNAANFSEN
jgi:hypothetical protein